jgi:glycosidase
MIKNKKYLLLAALVLLFAACGGDKPVTPPQPPTPEWDIVDQVSQYEAREFDGEKRAGVFYEIFVRSFADSDGDGIGDFGGVTAKLDYLDDLGVAGIWLMPIFETGSYHGYDIIDFERVNPEYGTMADFETLIDEAHKRQIRVILDFTPNHTSNQNRWFTEACRSETNDYRSFYHFSKTTTAGGWYQVPQGTTSYKYQGSFDRSMPDLNYGPASTSETSPAFEALTDAAKFWVDKGVDGFRLDAVKHIYDNETSNENPTFLGKFYTTLNSYFAGKSELGFEDIYMVGECWTGTDAMAKYYTGLPALFDFTAWTDRLLYAIVNSHAKWFPGDMIAEREVFARYRTDFIQATKLSNHDENRTRTAVGGGSLVASAERAKIAAAVLLTSIGSPYLYYGEEIGMLGDKSTGDINVREPFLWADRVEDTFRTTWTNSKVNTDIGIGNVASQAESVTSIYNVYRKFMRLRNSYPALAEGSISLPADFDGANNDNKQVMAFLRTHGTERLLVLHNVSATPSSYVINREIDRPIADMNHVTIESQGTNKHTVSMPPYSSIIIQM